MNLFLKDHHMTRHISQISGSIDGMILIIFEPTDDYCNEHLIFLKDELDVTSKQILLLNSDLQAHEKNDT